MSFFLHSSNTCMHQIWLFYYYIYVNDCTEAFAHISFDWFIIALYVCVLTLCILITIHMFKEFLSPLL